MGLDSTVVSGLIGAGAMFFLGAVPFFIGWGNLHAMIDALKGRVATLENQQGAIARLQADVAYIRGRLDQVLPPPSGIKISP